MEINMEILMNLESEIGININDKHQPFTSQILSGIKTIETRNSNSLKPYIGRRVGIIRTGKGRATLIGFCTIGEPIVYKSKAQFNADYKKHLVANGSKFYIKKVKYGYPLLDVEKTLPKAIFTRGIVSRKLIIER